MRRVAPQQLLLSAPGLLVCRVTIKPIGKEAAWCTSEAFVLVQDIIDPDVSSSKQGQACY